MTDDTTRLGPVTDICKARTLRSALADSTRLGALVILVTRVPVSSRNGGVSLGRSAPYPQAMSNFRRARATASLNACAQSGFQSSTLVALCTSQLALG